jgi:hypothetical protein
MRRRESFSALEGILKGVYAMRRIDAHLHCAGDRVLYGSDMV